MEIKHFDFINLLHFSMHTTEKNLKSTCKSNKHYLLNLWTCTVPQPVLYEQDICRFILQMFPLIFCILFCGSLSYVSPSAPLPLRFLYLCRLPKEKTVSEGEHGRSVSMTSTLSWEAPQDPTPSQGLLNSKLRNFAPVILSLKD